VTALDIAAAPSPTAALLWAASRPRPDPHEVALALDGGADLRHATDIAVAQRLSPLLWRALATAPPPSPDAEPDADSWRQELRADAARCRAQALIVLPLFADAGLAPLVAAGYEPVVMKGAALTDRYPEPGLRPMDDVDVLLPRREHDGAIRVLESAGWQRRDVPGRHYETVLTHPEVPGLPLELHRAFATWGGRANRLSAATLWERRQPRAIGGVDAFGFSADDEIVTLAAHAAKPFHVFSRLLWITDLAVVIDAAATAGTPIDWTRVEALTQAARCQTAVAVALGLAQRLGAPSPPELRRVPATGARLAALAPVLAPEWPVTERDVGLRNRLRYAFVDDGRLRVALLGESVVDTSPVNATRNAAATSVRLVRRWRQLRRSAEGGGEELGHGVEP